MNDVSGAGLGSYRYDQIPLWDQPELDGDVEDVVQQVVCGQWKGWYTSITRSWQRLDKF
jgi:hypothetical protein